MKNPNAPKTMQQFADENAPHKQLIIDTISLLRKNEDYTRKNTCAVSGEELTATDLDLQKTTYFHFVKEKYLQFATIYQLELALKQAGREKEYTPYCSLEII